MLEPRVPAQVSADKAAEHLIANERRLRRLAMVRFGEQVMLSPTETEALLTQAAKGPQPAVQLSAVLPESRRAAGLRALVVMMKLGVLRGR